MNTRRYRIWGRRAATSGIGFSVGTGGWPSFALIFRRRGIEKQLALDDVFAFFMNCYHLADWIMQDGEKSSSSR